MRWTTLACDYDGTLAKAGRVNRHVVEALKDFRRSGGKLVLVTGRQLEELLNIFPELELFDRVVAENGAMLYRPATGGIQLLANAPPARLIQELKKRKVAPLAIGRVILATSRRHARTVSATIRDLRVDHQVILNKNSLMILPPGVNKGAALIRVINGLRASLANTIGVGDAENDRDFLVLCGYAVAVANALPMLRRIAHLVTKYRYGAGVIEIVKRVLAADLQHSG